MHWLKAASCATIWLALCFISPAAISIYLWFGAWKAAFIVASRGEKGIREANTERALLAFQELQKTREPILEQHKNKVMRGEDLSLQSALKFPVSPVQSITYSVQLRRNLKEPKIVRAEIPRARGSGASAAPSPPGEQALTAPSGHQHSPSSHSRGHGWQTFPLWLCWKGPAQKSEIYFGWFFFFL